MEDALEAQLISLLKGIYRSSTFDEITQFWQGEMQVLYHIYGCAGEEIHPSTLSDQLGVTRARMTTALAGLRKKGLISMKVSPRDRRHLTVSLTERGRAFTQERVSLSSHRFRTLCGRLGRENVAEMVRLIQLSVQIMEEELAAEGPAVPDQGGNVQQ